MGYFPFGFKPIEPTTWAYLSSLLMLALFFKFNRFWSFRNFDLVLIILLAPGLLMVHYGETGQTQHQRNLESGRTVLEKAINDEMNSSASSSDSPTNSETQSPNESGVQNQAQNPAKQANLNPGADPAVSPPGWLANAGNSNSGGSKSGEKKSRPATNDAKSKTIPLTANQILQRAGYVWLFSVGALWLARLFYDPFIVRKPMLEPNLSVGGLVFLTCSLTIFLLVNVVLSQPDDLSGPQAAANLFQRNAELAGSDLQQYGPGYPVLHLIPSIRTFVNDRDNGSGQQNVNAHDKKMELVEVARIMAVLCQIAILAALIFIGKYHFGSFQMGIGMATIFMMLPYTAQYAGDSMHLLPGALLIWAVAMYRKPVVSGILIGAAAGVCYYPLFLLPLWISFYWERGRLRFILGAVGAIAVVISSLAFTSADFSGFIAQLQSIFGFILPRQDGLGGIWALNWQSWFRLPMLVGFLVLCVSYAFWPAVKDLASLISCTAAAMVAVQYWHGDGGGLYMAWYLPLFLLVIFRPNLDDKIANTVTE